MCNSRTIMVADKNNRSVGFLKIELFFLFVLPKLRRQYHLQQIGFYRLRFEPQQIYNQFSLVSVSRSKVYRQRSGIAYLKRHLFRSSFCSVMVLTSDNPECAWIFVFQRQHTEEVSQCRRVKGWTCVVIRRSKIFISRIFWNKALCWFAASYFLVFITFLIHHWLCNVLRTHVLLVCGVSWKLNAVAEEKTKKIAHFKNTDPNLNDDKWCYGDDEPVVVVCVQSKSNGFWNFSRAFLIPSSSM